MKLIWEVIKMVVMEKSLKILLKLAVAIVAVLVFSLFLSGCNAGNSNSEKTVPGAYGVDPRSISTSGINASDAAIVVAPCQGHAFRIPDQAFA